MRILAAFPATLEASYMIDETPFDAGDVTVTVTDASGVPVSTGAATQASVGEYSYALPAQTTLGVLTAVWAGAATVTTYPEVVGAQLISLADLRASDPAFSNTAKWTTAALAAARDEVTDEFARITGRSFIPRGGSYTHTIDATGRLLLPDTDIELIRSAVLDGTAVDVTTLTAHAEGLVTGVPKPARGLLGGWWDQELSFLLPTPGVFIISYLYGFSEVPSDVYRAAILRARWVLASSNTNIPDRATSYHDAEGTSYTLATAGLGPWQTGIPDVDAVLLRYTMRSRGVSAA